MTDETTLSTTVAVERGSKPNRDQIGAAAIAALKADGKLPEHCLPSAEINVEKTEAENIAESNDRVYHVDVVYRDLQPNEPEVTVDEVVASMLAPPAFDPDDHDEA